MKTIFAALLCVFALTGCTSPALQSAGSYPNDYKKLAADKMREDFFDPYTLKDVWISAPVEGHLQFNLGWIVCVRANGKDKAGTYAGRKEIAYLLNKGLVLEEGEQVGCADARYTEWVEMEMTGAAETGGK